MGAGTGPNITHTPIRLVGTRPFTRSLPVTAREVPAGAKFCPKMERMALGDATCIAGELKPPLTTPPLETAGAVGDATTVKVIVKVGLVKTPAAAIAVNVTTQEWLPTVALAGSTEAISAPYGVPN